MKIVRAIVGWGILVIDRLTAPKAPNRTPEAQKALDSRTANHTLYHLQACPFCVKVRRQIRRQGLAIPSKEIGDDPQAAAELIAGGKLDQVPCLRIDRGGAVEWMYESTAINRYLETTFGG
jgi:glutaredoxin